MGDTADQVPRKQATITERVGGGVCNVQGSPDVGDFFKRHSKQIAQQILTRSGLLLK